MRRLLFGIVVVGIALAVSVSQAQESGPPMPERVRTFLDNVTGRWTVGGSTQGTNEVRWDATGMVLLDTGQFEEPDLSGSWTGVWHWDGVSEDAIIVSWGSPTSHGFGYGQLHGKVLSPTVMEAQRTGVRQGKPVTEKVRVEFQSPDQYTWTSTDITVGGEKQPDYTEIYTRVNTGDAKQEALQAAMGWGAAREKKDIAYIDRLLADDLTCVHPDGKTAGKAQLLRVVKSPHFKSLSNDYDLDVRVYGDTAVITGLLTSEQYYNDIDWSGTIRLTETYVKRDGRWQCVATHASRIAEGTAEEGSKTQSDANKVAFRRLLAEITNDPKMESAEEILHKDFVFHGPGGHEVRGIQAFKNDLEYVRRVFPDYHETEEETIAEGDFVASRWTSTGTHVKNGKKFKMTNITIDRLQDGKIVETWYLCDNATRQKQLGLENVFALD